MKKEQTEVPAEKLTNWASRNLIALIITGLVVGITVYIAIYILYQPVKNADGSVSINLTFIGQTLLPLWGTWMGTVLAFYFGKANFEVATKTMQDAMKTLTPEEKIAKLPVKDVMLQVKDLVYLDYDTELQHPIAAILKYPQFEPYNRFAVLDKSQVVKYMVHRGLFYQFLYARYNEQKAAGTTPDTDSVLLSELFTSTDDQFRKPLTRGSGFVSINASLLDAKRVIDATDECQDVFITSNGKPGESVLGLLTNNRIFQYAKV